MTDHEPGRDEQLEDAATVRVPPPLVFVAGLVVAGVLGWVWPRNPWVGGWLGLVVGGLSVLGGIALIANALGQHRRTGQDPKPWRPSPAILTEGPYAITRNPMYLGMALVSVGIGYVLGNGWFAITAALAAFVVQKLAIEPEEAYLERTFGDAYLAYKRRVRRWV